MLAASSSPVNGTARLYAKRRELSETEEAGVAAHRQLAGHRADLLPERAGIEDGTSEREPANHSRTGQRRWELTNRAFTEHCGGHLTTEETPAIKWRDTEPRSGVTDRCVQLHGEYGYNREYLVGHAWADSRVQSVFGGTTEIMKEIIGRGLGL
jgi:alkylation response protein AidB-like acyl-CoA dehydrogenase